jgi:hypothetical protein
VGNYELGVMNYELGAGVGCVGVAFQQSTQSRHKGHKRSYELKVMSYELIVELA